MKLQQAQQIADRIVGALGPYCSRIKIAGSIRRQKPEVGDIEIVCIPLTVDQQTLFAGPVPVRHPEFVRLVNSWPKVKGNGYSKYTQRLLPEGIKLDLFTATPVNWGHILAIRTGSANFSHKILGARWVSQGFKSENGYLTRHGQVVPAPTEREYFHLLGLAWVEPGNRN